MEPSGAEEEDGEEEEDEEREGEGSDDVEEDGEVNTMDVNEDAGKTRRSGRKR